MTIGRTVKAICLHYLTGDLSYGSALSKLYELNYKRSEAKIMLDRALVDVEASDNRKAA